MYGIYCKSTNDAYEAIMSSCLKAAMSLVLLKLEQGYHFGDVLLGKNFAYFIVIRWLTAGYLTALR
jgi:hypothetical protein